jgi:uncharacterized paraquat-inducible protein A
LKNKSAEIVRRYFDLTHGINPVARCDVCGSLTALYQLDDAERPICPRHGADSPLDKLLMDANAHILLDHFFQPDMANPQ